MKKRLISLVMCSWIASGKGLESEAFTPLTAEDLASYSVTYQVYRDGSEVGQAERTLVKTENGLYQLKMRAEASILFYSFKTCETSQFLLEEGRLKPYEYKQLEKQTFKDNKKLDLRFDSKNALVNARSNKKQWEMAFDEPGYDPLLVIEWLKHVASQGGDKDIEADVYNKEKVSVYHFVFEGTELINSPIGEINTVKYTRVRDNSSRRTNLWFSVESPFLPVQVRQEKDGEEQARMLISSFSNSDQIKTGPALKWKIDC